MLDLLAPTSTSWRWPGRWASPAARADTGEAFTAELARALAAPGPAVVVAAVGRGRQVVTLPVGRVDFNADVGEVSDPAEVDAALLDEVLSASVACAGSTPAPRPSWQPPSPPRCSGG